MRRPERQDRRDQDMILAGCGFAAFGVLALAVVIVWAAAAAGGHGHGSPAGWAKEVATGGTRGTRGTATWSTTATVVLIVELMLMAAAGAWAARAWWRWSKSRARIDARAKYMSTNRDIDPLTERASKKAAAELGVVGVGLPVGTSVLRKRRLWSGWEWSLLMVMGTRAGKTSCEVVPRILSATGMPVVSTSNKPDVFYDTRAAREAAGAVWCLDLQNIAGQGEDPHWWWNILDFVDGVERADELVDILSAAVTPGNARTDAYFTSASRALLSGLLLAAAVGHKPVTQVYDWLSDPNQRMDHDDPMQLLEAHGYDQVATDLREKMNLTEKQRDGVYGGAREWVSFMRSPGVVQWITTTGPNDQRRRFTAAQFVASTDTLYLLSKGRGGAAGRAVVAALTRAVMLAGEELAARQGGRVTTPIIFELDEAANVCRIPELPDLFTYYGGLGLLVATYLQNPAQGEECWGENGWRQMYSSANALLIGRGIRDEKFLPGVVQMIGDRHWTERTRTRGRGGSSTSESHRQEHIVTLADLTALEQGRAILHASGSRPILVRLDHWSATTSTREAVTSSRDLYRPDGSQDSTDVDNARPMQWAATTTALHVDPSAANAGDRVKGRASW